MAYATYITEAIVCGSKDSYTSDRSYLLFTETAGMLWATARGVREERSKQRYALCEFSIIRVSLVRGKSGWRIGSVEALENPYWQAGVREARTGLRDIVQLLRRFLHGEEPNAAVFADTRRALEVLVATAPEEQGALSDLFELRLLHHLGYIAPHADYNQLLADDLLWDTTQPLPAIAQSAIERAKTVSHL